MQVGSSRRSARTRYRLESGSIADWVVPRMFTKGPAVTLQNAGRQPAGHAGFRISASNSGAE